MRIRISIALLALTLTACSSGDAEQRVAFDEKPEFASAPMESPETQGALWQTDDNDASIGFGIPTRPPLFTVACVGGSIFLTRHASADPKASALMPLIGNGQIERVEVDAVKSGDGYVWQGVFLADDERLAVFNGSGSIEATVPGAGTIDLAPDDRVAGLIASCAGNDAKEAAPPTP